MKGFRNVKCVAMVLCGLLTFGIAAGFGAPVTVFAEETEGNVFDGQGTVDGVEFTVKTDKETYEEGDRANITLELKNTNAYDLSDIEVRFLLPNHLNAKDAASLTQKVNKIASGETRTYEIKDVEMAKNPNVQTGSGLPVAMVVGFVIGVLVVIAVAVILVSRKKKLPKTPVSVLLLLAMLAGLFASATEKTYAFTDDGLAEYWDYSHITCHDPSIVKDPKTGKYYVFGSHLAAGSTEDLIGWFTLRTNINDDFRELFAEPWAWSEQGNKQAANLDGRMWAPDIIWNENMKKWCMYMSIDGDYWMTTICLLTADDIEGPYEYQGIVVWSGMNNEKTHGDPKQTDIYKVLGEDADLTPYESTNFSCINAIDPCVKFDENGDLWMAYGSWSAGIYILKLDKNTGFRDYDTKYETIKDESDGYFGTKLAGGYYASGEGCYILKVGDYWYMFLSYGGLESQGGYQMRIYRSDKIDGPYVDQKGNSPIVKTGTNPLKKEMGVKIFGSCEIPGEPSIKVAQGHNSALLDDDGRIYLIYHSRFASQSGDPNMEGMHSMYCSQLFQTEDGWLVSAPYDYAGEKLDNDLKPEDVEGEYAFVVHDPLQYYETVKNSDGEFQKIGIVKAEGALKEEEVSIKKELMVGETSSTITCKVSFSHPQNSILNVKADGTVSGIKSGTWKFTNGANVEMDLDGVTYTGVFLRQRDDTTDKNVRMTFSILGDNVTAWGVWTDAQANVTPKTQE